MPCVKDSAPEIEKRKGLNALPAKYQLEEVLDLEQLILIRQMENFGWELKIVRRKGLPTAIALLQNHVSKNWIAILEGGELLDGASIKIR